MKGVILAGGLGTRLYPLTYATNKHLLPVYNQPMIFYPIRTLVGAGISDILVITSGPHAGHFIRVLKNGKGRIVRVRIYKKPRNVSSVFCTQTFYLTRDGAE